MTLAEWLRSKRWEVGKGEPHVFDVDLAHDLWPELVALVEAVDESKSEKIVEAYIALADAAQREGWKC